MWEKWNNSLPITVQTGPSAHTDVLTYKNNLSRTGLNSTETQLTIANVNSAGFGLKFHRGVWAAALVSAYTEPVRKCRFSRVSFLVHPL
jgi:hypothetical protein